MQRIDMHRVITEERRLRALILQATWSDTETALQYTRDLKKLQTNPHAYLASTKTDGRAVAPRS